MRGDLGPIVRCLFGKYVYQHRRYMYPIGSFSKTAYYKNYLLIDIDLLGGFPKDELIFKYFMLDKVYK